MERSIRIATAVFVLAGGFVHLQLWDSGYRGISYIGPLFVVNGVVSAILAIAVLVRRSRPVVVGGIAFSFVTLAALVMSRTVGLLGFTEREWTDQAVRATAAEVGAIVAFFALLVAFNRRGVVVAARARRSR